MSTDLTTTQIFQGLRTVQAVLAPELNPDELRLFAMVASRSGLDPFAKQIYAVKRKGRVTFQTGIDGYRSIAARTGLYDGQDEPLYGPACGCGDGRPAGHPEWATVRVYRKGVGRAIAATAYWHEYKPAPGRDPERPQDAMWVRMPRVMLAKVAEALALRKAFPYDPERHEGIGADLYTADEMAQAERAAPTTVRERVAARAQDRRLSPAPAAELAPDEVEGELVPESPADDSPSVEEIEAVADEIVDGEVEMSDEEARHAFAAATALIPRETVAETARRTFPGIASSRYTVRHWRALADELGVEL